MRHKFIYHFLIAALLIGGIPLAQKAEAKPCPSLRIVFVNDIDGGKGTSPDYLGFKAALEPALQTSHLDYEFVDLNYPAIGIKADNLRITAPSQIDVGNLEHFNESVDIGSQNLTKLVNSECATSKYLLAGYSEGAMVISKTLPNLDTRKIIYAATFGDPLIYLPEGASDKPDACSGNNLSNYRADVSDCRAYQGLFGSLLPYQPNNFIDKLGAWCNQDDAICSSNLNAYRHTTYIEDGIYQNAAPIILNQINHYFDTEFTNISTHQSKPAASSNLQFKKPELKIVSSNEIAASKTRIDYEIDGPATGVAIIINNNIIGLATERSIYLENLQPNIKYQIRLVPIKKYLLGNGIDIIVQTSTLAPQIVIPKTPNTGRN